MKTLLTLPFLLTCLWVAFSCQEKQSANGSTTSFSVPENLEPAAALQLALAHFDSARYDQALSLCKKSAESAEPATILRSNLLAGQIHALRYEPQQAAAFFQKAQAACGQIQPANDTLVAELHEGLSWQNFYRFDWKTALAEARKSLALRQKIFGSEAPETAASHNAVGRNLQEMQWQGSLDSALWHHQKALEIQQKTFGEFSAEAGVTLTHIANAWRLLMKDRQALEAAEKAVYALEKCGLKNHPAMAEALLLKGMELNANFRGDETEDEFQEALKIFGQAFGENSVHCGRVWQAMGEGFQNRLMFGDQLDYSLKAIAVFEQHQGGEFPWAALAWRYAGIGYEELLRYKEVQPCYDKAVPLMKRFWGEDSRYLADFMARSGRSFNKVGDSVTALKKGKDALDMYARLGEPVGVGAGVARWTIGMMHWENSLWDSGTYWYDSAAYWMNQGLKTIVAADAVENPRIPWFCQILSDAYFKLNRRDKMTETMWMGVKSLGLDKNPGLLETARFSSEVKRAAMAFVESNKKKFEETRDTTYLHQALRAAYSLLRMVREQLAETSNDESRQVIKSHHDFAFHQVILLLGYLNRFSYNPARVEEAFRVSEEYKALFLFEGIAREEAMRRAGMADRLIQKTKALGAAVAEAEDGLHGAEILGDSASVVSERSRLFTARQDYQNHLVDIERKYPAYSAWKNRDYLPTVKAVQEKLLDEHTALVSILVTGVRTSAFVITQKDIRYHTCHTCEVYNSRKLRPVLDTLLHSLKPQLEVPDSVQFQRLIASATTLYDSLLRVSLSHLGDSIDHLIIIPDDFLSQDVPFELLGDYSAWKNKPPVSFAELPFLLKKYTVQYAPSCNLLLYQMEQKREKAPRLFAGFAPKYESSDTLAPLLASRSALVRDGLYDLPGAREEVQTIASMTHGNVFLDRSASETSFKSEVENYRILHLAAHSLLDENNPNFSRLLLSHTPGDTSEDNNLNAIELQNLRLRADFAVLSACNTGTGLLQPGEGAESLSRAFMQAGVPATIMSQWKVPDEATRQIMVEFYKNLKAGQRKDEALRNAKLAYLASTSDPWLASPWYWAGFVAAGDMRPVDMRTSDFWSGWKVWALVFVGLGLLAVLGRVGSRRIGK